MTAKRVLVQWIGHSDLRAMAASLPPAQRDEIMEVVKGERPKQDDLGPGKTLLSTEQFDEVRLLSNYPLAWNKKYVAWLLQPIPGEGSSIRMIRRVGDGRERQVDVRIIAATNRDLHDAIRDGSFREDLYYRLATLSITLPPLRDRKSDIPKIAEKLLAQINRQFEAEEPNYQHKTLSAPAIGFVKKHDWPGNVRQLYNVLVQAAVLAEGTTLGRGDLVAALGEMPEKGSRTGLAERPLGDDFDLEKRLNDIHRQYLQQAMLQANGVKAEAARLLGMKHYQTLDAQLKRLGVDGDSDT
ncbi:MAG: sigma-54-dependent Fis family transcriptional regulator [Planctomycetaceae bacterium]|nr:MAG: sigma-54-dependent Fis family transcriptional regulator [Planctomycetaceae bacterium]